MFNPSREQVRLFFDQTWTKGCQQQTLTAIEKIAFEIIRQHLELIDLKSFSSHALANTADPSMPLIDPSAAVYHRSVSNPYLHLSLHLAVSEQLSIDQPKGISLIYQSLINQLQSTHQAQHIIMNCLQKELAYTQQQNRPLDGQQYLKNIADSIRN